MYYDGKMTLTLYCNNLYKIFLSSPKCNIEIDFTIYFINDSVQKLFLTTHWNRKKKFQVVNYIIIYNRYIIMLHILISFKLLLCFIHARNVIFVTFINCWHSLIYSMIVWILLLVRDNYIFWRGIYRYINQLYYYH